MSFDLFLQRFESGNEAPSSPDAVLDVLKEYGGNPSESGDLNIQFGDRGSGEFSAMGMEPGGKFSGCAFHLRGFSRQITHLVFAVAQAGDFVIFNPQGQRTETNPSVIVTDESQIRHLPDVGTNPILYHSHDQLDELLRGSGVQWRAYRDQIVASNN
jgi:hypothetical protein